MTRTRPMMVTVSTVALLALAGCAGGFETQADTRGIVENGDYIGRADKKVIDCKDPSIGGYVWADDVYQYPAGQRTFTFRGDGAKADAPAIKVITGDDQTVTVNGTLYFELTNDCDQLKKFHVNVGRKKWAGQPAYIGNDGDLTGWGAMLDTTLGGPLLASFQTHTPAYKTLDLYKNTAMQGELRDKVLEALPAQIQGIVGGGYFTKFSLRFDPPVPPDSTIQALDQAAAAASQRAAQVAQNETAKSQYATLKDCLDTDARLTADDCAFIFAVNSGKVTAVVPPGSMVNVPR